MKITRSELKQMINEAVQNAVYLKESMNIFDLKGLRMCLKRFDITGDYAKNRRWEIGNGGYDLNWELYYDRMPVIDCVYPNRLEIVDTYGNSNIERVIDIIKSEYPDCKYVDEDEE